MKSPDILRVPPAHVDSYAVQSAQKMIPITRRNWLTRSPPPHTQVIDRLTRSSPPCTKVVNRLARRSEPRHTKLMPHTKTGSPSHVSNRSRRTTCCIAHAKEVITKGLRYEGLRAGKEGRAGDCYRIDNAVESERGLGRDELGSKRVR